MKNLSLTNLGRLLSLLLSMSLILCAAAAHAEKICPKCGHIYSNDQVDCPRDLTHLVAYHPKKTQNPEEAAREQEKKRLAHAIAQQQAQEKKEKQEARERKNTAARLPIRANPHTTAGSTPSRFIKPTNPPPPPPTITDVTPDEGPPGTPVTITGTGLKDAKVRFNDGTETTPTTDDDTKITVAVPDDATEGTITVTTPGGTASSAVVNKTFSPIPKPEIESISPGSGPVGTPVTITGTGLSNANPVSFTGSDGTPLDSNTDKTITLAVPKDAKSGVITVTTPGGPAHSQAFTVIPSSVDSVTPGRAIVGKSVTITGAGLSLAKTVSFGGAADVPCEATSDKTITIVVPPDAKTGVVTVTTPEGAVSGPVFTVDPGINYNDRLKQNLDNAISGHGDWNAVMVDVSNHGDVQLHDDEFGKTVLMKAVAAADTTVLDWLFDTKHFSVNTRDYLLDGTPLMVAAQLGKRDIAEYLINKGADVAAADNSGKTALIQAAASGDAGTVQIILSKLSRTADVNAVDVVGQTALMYAALKGNVDTVESLVNAGADVNVTAKTGNTALAIAQSKNYDSIVAFLKRHGAK